MNRFWSRTATVAALLCWMSTVSAESIVVEQAWVRWMPPVAEHTAAYMVLHNHGAEERRLIGGTAPAFARVEVHESRDEDGVYRMVHLDELVIPAGGSVVLEPGGYHVMLMGRQTEPLAEGDSVELELHFANGERLSLTLPVRRGEGGGHHHGHGGHHGH